MRCRFRGCAGALAAGLVIASLVGCGRIAYDPLSRDGGARDANAPDSSELDGVVPVDLAIDGIGSDLSSVIGIDVSPISGLVTNEAGATAMFTIVLRSRPSADVLFSVLSGDASEGTTSPLSLTFTVIDWNVPQTVTVTGVDDTLVDGNQMYNVTLHVTSSADTNYLALADQVVSITNLDDETPGVNVATSSGSMTSEAGASVVFMLSLTAEPTASVTIPLSSNDTTEGTVSPASLTFTTSNWSVPQLATMTGVDDSIVDGDVAYLFVVGPATSSDSLYMGVDGVDAVLTNIDDDVSGVVVAPTSGLSTTEAGGTAMFTVALSSQPTADVLIALASDDISEGVAVPASLTFTTLDWATPQTVTVTGVDDALFDGNIGYTVVTASAVSADASYNGVNPSDVAVTNADNESVVGQQAYMKASNTGAADQFANAVAISADGNTLVVGSQHEDSNATGVDGSQASNAATESGAVYVFTRSGSVWTQQAYIKASNTGMGDEFGNRVAISSDGNTIAVAAYSEGSNATGVDGNQSDNSAVFAGAVYTFTRSGVVWTQQAYVKQSNTEANDTFGYGIALSGDGDTLAIGAVYESSAASGIGGNQADNTLGASGAVYVLTRSAGVWSQQSYVKASTPGAGDWFGCAVALSSDGNTMAVGAWNEDSSATGIGGNQMNNGAGDSGATYVFTRSASVWTQQAYIKASDTAANAQFGACVSLTSDGAMLAVGAPVQNTSGAVYIFTRSAGVWSQQALLKATPPGAGDQFGSGQTVALSPEGLLLVVGSVLEDSSATGIDGNAADNSVSNSGAAYIFSRTGTVWSQTHYLKASNTGTNDYFGVAVAISSAAAQTTVISAYAEDSSATGIGGSQIDNSASDSGALYVFYGL